MKRLFWLSLGILLLTSCDRPTTLSGRPSSPYHELLSELTQNRRSYGIEKVPYETSVAYLSPELRAAYVNEYARVYQLSDSARQTMMTRQLEEGEKYDSFFISHFATDKETARITSKPEVWKISLAFQAESGDQEVEPQLIETQPSGRDPVTQYFYPFVTPWSNNYLVKFPKVGAAGPIVLELHGVVADVRFSWNQNH